MKLHTLICASAIAAATGASALTTANTFARMPVTTSLENTLLAIPLAGCGEASPEIYVTNLVMTTGLSNGDKLLYKDSTGYYAWYISGGKWMPMAAADASSAFGEVSITPRADEATLLCGKGCWLVQTNPTTVYLYGQVNEGAVTTVIAAGTSTGPTYTIVSRPYETGSVNLNTWHAENAVVGDTLVVAKSGGLGQDTYTWGKDSSNNDGWTTVTVTKSGSGKTATYTYTTNRVTATISAGTAFMYGRAKNAAATTINWTR